MEQRSATCYIFTVLPPAGRELLRVLFRDLPAAFLPVIQIGVFRPSSPYPRGARRTLVQRWHLVTVAYEHEPNRQEGRR